MYKYIYIYILYKPIFFWVARKKTCFFKIIRFFFSKAFGYGKLRVTYGKLWVNYGPIMGRNLENQVFLKNTRFLLNILKKKHCLLISTPKKWVNGAIGCYIPKSIQKNSGNVQSPGCLIDAYGIIVYMYIYIYSITYYITYYILLHFIIYLIHWW